MKVALQPDELTSDRRAIAIGTFDGVHRGHRRVIEAALTAGLRPTVVTFNPHPRTVLGHRVELLTTLERRLELIAELGMEETLVLEFSLDLAHLEPAEFAESILRRIGADVIVAGPGFRFGRSASGDLGTLTELGFDARTVPLVEGVSSSAIRAQLQAGRIQDAARQLGRPPAVEGTVVAGDRRGSTLGFPTANVAVATDLLVPGHGIYAGAAAGHRAAVSIGTNPHYGGRDRRIEAFLIDFDGDLYGERLVVELWERLRDERAFASEAELIEAIARDVEATRAASSPI